MHQKSCQLPILCFIAENRDEMPAFTIDTAAVRLGLAPLEKGCDGNDTGMSLVQFLLQIFRCFFPQGFAIDAIFRRQLRQTPMDLADAFFIGTCRHALFDHRAMAFCIFSKSIQHHPQGGNAAAAECPAIRFLKGRELLPFPVFPGHLLGIKREIHRQSNLLLLTHFITSFFSESGG